MLLSDLKLADPGLDQLLTEEKDVVISKDPTDPLFDKEWFLVRKHSQFCLFFDMSYQT